ncbi:ABC transporter substrate-binding protein [Clostridium oryzae]|uniref:Putative ABC transporter substrate-binding protein YesO n=1 Tax=Clostridium oryzae TaxID=1450648 RepID=A0A1V4IRR1_9CLOT|nr:sugar ABC transporter substrate-binding protein [Clostridium oryzae]OPJ62157.1 putative ABC transporter substrate-binding protein YesO [Clostridium oryzae]
MNMKSKKTISVVLSSLFIAGIFAGCSKKGGSSNTSNGVTTLKVAMWNEPSKDKNLDVWYQYGKKHSKVKLEPVVIPEDQYSQKINQMVAAGNAPDILIAWECDLQNLARGKKVVSLDNYISKSKVISANDFIPAVKALKDLNGATYGLPYGYACEILYYNKDLFDKAKVSYPTNNWTMDDFKAAAEKLTVVKNGKTVQFGADGMSFAGGWWSGIGAQGDAIVGKDGKLEIGEGAKKFLTMQKELVSKKVIPAPSADSAGADLFASGKAAMTRTGSWMVNSYKDLPFKWDIAQQPKGTINYNTLHTGMYCIPETTKNKQAAWKAIEWLMGDEAQRLFSKSNANPSARPSVAAKGDWKVQGKNGPSNWAAFDEAAKSGKFGYVLLPSGVTADSVKQFEAAILGQKSIDAAINQAKKSADEVLQN